MRKTILSLAVVLFSFFFIVPQVEAQFSPANCQALCTRDPHSSACSGCLSGQKGGLNLSDYFTLGKSPDTVAGTYSTPAEIVNVVVRNLFVVAGIIFFLMIIYSGFKFVYQGKKGAEDVKTIMTAAVAGLGIMFASYWIVQILEIVTGVEIIL